jgi:HEPN domain-containing protein
LETAGVLLKQGGYPEIIGYHLHQAIEKHLKGYLIHNGLQPPRTHDLDTLLNLASEFCSDLYDAHIDLCERATRFYLEDRYPPGPPSDYTREEISVDFDQASDLVRALRRATGL